MAAKVFFSVTMSLDGFVAPESLSELMGEQWMELQQWMFPQRFIRENLKLGEGGEEGRDNDIDGVAAGHTSLEPIRAEPTRRVTHVTYAVRER